MPLSDWIKLFTFFSRETQSFQQLEEDVKALRRRCRKLEDRVEKLEAAKEHADTSSRKSDSGFQKKLPETFPPRSDKTSGKLYQEGQKKMEQSLSSASEVEIDVSNVVGEQNIFKFLTLKIFSQDEIISCTRTGKRTAKSGDEVKPQLDPEKFYRLENLVLKHTSMDKCKFYKKFENLQKVLRNKLV